MLKQPWRAMRRDGEEGWFVDRGRRDEVAEALASFLCGEMGHRELLAVFQRIEMELRSLSARDSYLDTLLFLGTMEGSQGPSLLQMENTRKNWEELCRHLAFLKSDLEQRERGVDLTEFHAMDSPRMIRFRRWSSLGVLAACGLAYFTSWWVIPIALLVSLAMTQSPFLDWIRLTPEEKRRLEERRAFDPFIDREDWMSHRHLLDSFDLPDYDPTLFGSPPNAPKRSRFFGVPVHFFMYAGIASVMIFLFVWSALIGWPLMLVGAWFPESKRDGGQLGSV